MASDCYTPWTFLLTFYWFSSDLLLLGSIYLVVSKSSEFAIKNIQALRFSSCNIKIVCLHQLVRLVNFTLHWLFLVQLVANLDSQISEVIALNPSFTMFSSKLRLMSES